MRKLVRRVAIPVGMLMAVLTLSSCTQQYASANSDTHVCVFDGSERGGQKLKAQVPPGAKSVAIDDNDYKVEIPASNRFYLVTGANHPKEDRPNADPGTKPAYTANAGGGAPVLVEGQVRFKFNLEKACEWFSKHGRRNAKDGNDLGFNVRGDANQGWFRFLNENFGFTMQEVVSERLGGYDWAALHFNYPSNSDAAGIVPAGQPTAEPTRQKLGKELGQAFTERITANLGGQYFCGIDPDPNGGESTCPPMRFQVTYAGPGDENGLVKDRQKVENTKQQLETARLEGELRGAQQAQLLAAEKAKAAQKAAEAETAEQQARIDTAKCRQYAVHGLDCEGKHAPVIVNGQQR